MTVFSLAFWFLFAFWIVALWFGLRGGVITYALLLVAIFLLVRAGRTRKT